MKHGSGIGTGFGVGRKKSCAGDTERALSLTPEAVVDRLVVAGTPDDWIEQLGAIQATRMELGAIG
jgi:hypothetical protein